jgi:hypothetical protein
MSRFIPNENSYIGFSPTVPADLTKPAVADITAAIDLTDYISGLNFSATGSALPTPSLATLFETSIPGTTTATATLDAYRDDEDDLAWDTLPRATEGCVFVSRYGGTPAVAGDKLEVWPVRVISRTASNMTNNTVQTFTCTFSVPQEPSEDSVLT